MSAELLNDGGAVVVTAERDRVGQGPWARLFATAVVPDEGSSTAERGRVLARAGEVAAVRVRVGAIEALVADCAVTLSAEPVPPRIWSAMTRYARGKRPLEAAVEGREQSVHLEHLMTTDWEEPLVPPARALRRTCTCDGEACEHIAALGYAIAEQIDRDPSLLLRWRGCGAQDEPSPAPPETVATVAPDGDPWQAGSLPAPRPLRPLPSGAVLKRLGPSGVRVDGVDLADVLQRAYDSFAASDGR
jgi:uncharacterized Zn finger protein